MDKIYCTYCDDNAVAVYGTAGGLRLPNRCQMCYIRYCQSRICKHRTLEECRRAHSLNSGERFHCWFTHVKPVYKAVVFKRKPVDID